MRSTAQMFGVLNELIFLLVGALLLWVALTDRYVALNPRGAGWLVLAGVIALWGVYTWRYSLRVASRTVRLAMKIGGSSLILVGTIMLALVWAPFQWAGQLLAAAGVVFIVRGLVTAALLAFSS